MAVRMGIRELRDNLTATMRRVRAGETIEVTHHDEPVALITPIPTDRIARLLARPDVTPPAKPLRLPRRLHPPTTGITASEALEDDRAADR